jgi:cytoskeletal protein RodZ
MGERKMKNHRSLLATISMPVLAFVLCGFPEYCTAQQDAAQQQNSQSQQTQVQGTTVNPAKGPLAPIPTQDESTQNPVPSAPPASPQALPSEPSPQSPPEASLQEPVGAATAEGVPTVGGAASRPAGEAIAPAKQGQRRSLLLKVGLIAAAGVAAGVVYALSKGTPSKP